jgi:hypothetical protein
MITLACTRSEHIMRCVHLQGHIHDNVFDMVDSNSLLMNTMKHILKAHTAFSVHYNTECDRSGVSWSTWSVHN